MAAADYRLCDQCGCKAFYDAGMYDFDPPAEGVPDILDNEKPKHLWTCQLGGWAVLCRDCVKTHKAVVVPRSSEGGAA